MESEQFVRAKLETATGASCSESNVSNNRYIYVLLFERSVDWQLLYGEIQSVNADMDVDLEMADIRPSGVANFEVAVREVERRAEIDDSQESLYSFERKT
jgi:hypothetical protein